VSRARADSRRDDAARLSDENADLRDRVAEATDRAARQNEAFLIEQRRSPEATIRALVEAGGVAREAAADGRAAAARDRLRAADDRVYASRASSREVEHADLDGLTGLYMRELGTLALEGELDRSRRSGDPFVLASVDIDGLKALNVAEGLAAGDALLQSVVGVLWSKLRSYDTIVRVAGDRFLCGLSNTEVGAARRRAEEMRVAVAELRGGSGVGPESVTVGLATLSSTDTLAELTTRANEDMYSRKARKVITRATGKPASSASTGPRLSIVIPTLNEAINLPHIFAALPDGLHEVIVVDGASTDDTVGVAQMLRPDVRIVSQDRRGKGNALSCGFLAATGDVIVMLDADGSADPSEIPRFLAALQAGADFAKGSRFLDGGGGSADITRLRRFGNLILNGLVNTLYGTRYTDLCYGYNAFWRHCLPVLDVDCDGFEVETMINCRIARAGLTVAEVPSFESARINGHSNLHVVSDGARVLRTLVRERVRRAPPSVPHSSSPTGPEPAGLLVGSSD
jgi:diguanylate cyclase (GGDEF)-like protein